MSIRRSLVAAAFAVAAVLAVSAPAIASLSDSGVAVAQDCIPEKCGR